jgi:TetR/AcrR family transcriptional repressor of nem operon
MSARVNRNPAETRAKLLDATRVLMLRQGFSATGVDEICREAGVTKGAFFHHFKTKEDLGRAALAQWAAFGRSFYEQAAAAPAVQPLDQVHRFFDIMAGIVEQHPGELSCLVGMLTQEMAFASGPLRESCGEHLVEWTALVRDLLRDAKKAQPPRVAFDPEEVAWFLNSLWQGSMLVGKTRPDPAMILRNLQHGRAYVDALFSGAVQPLLA